MAPKAASSGKWKRTTSKQVLESMESSVAGINGGTLEEGNNYVARTIKIALANYHS